jgi:hypothetical protein
VQKAGFFGIVGKQSRKLLLPFMRSTIVFDAWMNLGNRADLKKPP